MKKQMLWLLMIACSMSWVAVASNGALVPSSNAAFQDSETLTPLPSIRRIGIEPLKTNVEDFREFMRNDARKVVGLTALPLTVEETSQELTRILDKAIRASGRFWTLSVESSIDIMTAKRSSSGVREAKSRLQRTYDLEGWLGGEVYFSPEQTIIRALLRNAKDESQIWAREDIIVAPQPSTTDLEKGLQAAVTRLISTLGHDGRVVWEREELVGIDFGVERGLARGARLQAGYVILSAQHPQTREFLRSKRIRIMDLEVVDPREGSTLCRVIGYNKVADTEIRRLLPAGPTLVWRDPIQTPSTVWKEAAPTEMKPLIGAVDAGFHSIDKAVREGPARESPQNASRILVSPSPSPAPEYPLPAVVEQAGTQEKPLQSEMQESESEEPPLRRQANKNLAIWSDPSTWRPSSASMGGGIRLGSWKSARGTKTSGFPETILNNINLNSTIDIDDNWTLEPIADFGIFGKGELKGTVLRVTVPALTQLWESSDSIEHFSAGFGPSLAFGEVTTPGVRGAQNLSQLSLLAMGGYGVDIPSFGTIRSAAGLSIFDLFNGMLSGDFNISVRPSKILPRPLGFHVTGHFGPEKWQEFALGANWDFLATL